MGVGGSVAAIRVENVEEIPENGMKEIVVNEDGDRILIVRENDRLYGIGPRCPHYGAHLVNGAVVNGKIRCPWHGACFSLETGDIEDFPGLDCLPTYKVKMKGKSLLISENSKGDLKGSRRQKIMAKMKSTEPTYVIIGSGAAGLTAAQTLREEGFEGSIVMLTKDKYLPYDRTKLSKAPGSNWENIKLRDKNFYEMNDIQLNLGVKVQSVNFEEKKIQIDGKKTDISYDKLLIATGLMPRKYPSTIPGSDLKNILTLYSIEDSKKLMVSSEEKKVVIIGSSFIAMELASALKSRAKSIDLVSRSEFPYSAVLGQRIGRILLGKLLTENEKIKFHPKVNVSRFIGGGSGEISGVALDSGEGAILDCDLAIMAIGASPNTEWLRGSGLELHTTDHTIIVNQHLETNIKDVYAAGDVTRFPCMSAFKKEASIAHWQIAQTHGKFAALSMLDRPQDVSRTVPFFWTNVAGVNIRYAGYGEDYDEINTFGTPSEFIFCSLYTRKKSLLAIVSANCDPLCAQVAEEMKNGADFGPDTGFPKCVLKKFPDPPIVGIIPSDPF